MTSAIEARQRLDKVLASSALSDTAILSSLVRKQLHKTSAEKLATDEVVEKKCNQLLKLLDALRSAKGERTTKVVDGEWKVKQDTPRFRVMYREGPEGAPYHSLCLDGIIEGPMSHALCVGCEVPMYKEWWPQFAAPTFKIVESRWLERDTVGGDYSVLRFKVPWPFAMREVILSAFELEYFDEDLVAVLYQSAPDVADEKVDGISTNQIPPLNSNAVRMDLDGGFVLQKIGHNCSFFRIVVDLDMKLDIVPPWLINFIARQLVGHGYKLYQKAVSGVKGSKLEKLADSDRMYKRIQALDNASLNVYEPTLLEEITAIKKGPYKEEEIDSIESALKSFTDQELSKAFKQQTEDAQIEEKQHTDAPLSKSILHSNNSTVPNGLSNGNHESNPDCFVPIAEINGIEIATASVEREQQLRPHSEGDGPTDPEVVWALQMLEKFIAHFKSQKAAAQTSGSRDTPGVQNETADNPESVYSSAMADSFHDSNEYLDTQDGGSLQNSTSQHDTGGIGSSQSTVPSVKVTAGAAVTNGTENGTKHSLTTSDFDRVKGLGSDEIIIALPEGQQNKQHPHTHHRGFRFFRFRKRHKDKEKKSSKRHEQAVAIEN
ncbi:hypothetical protein KC19_10G017800 [Ceratodon purpureus]|uniref:START domain-containing protein n=1 Tax=Ceratodon purpureus TaxID=3225 RepID=A0A8T0GI98_CERPU|nr:hypothetical protein KC19_10G017800 [Ceratodon purpureus]